MASRFGKRPLGPVEIGGAPMPYSKGVVANGFVFLTGLDGRVDDAGSPVDGIGPQTTLALDRGRAYLEEAGTTPEHIVRIVQYIADPVLFDEFHKARDQWMAKHAPALLADLSYAGVLVVQAFTKADRLVEIEVTAVLPDNEGGSRT